MVEVQALGAAIGGLLCGAGLSAFYYQRKLQKEVEALKDFKESSKVQELRELLTEVVSKLSNLQNVYEEDFKSIVRELKGNAKKAEVVGLNLSEAIKEAEKVEACKLLIEDLRKAISQASAVQSGVNAEVIGSGVSNAEELRKLIKEVNGRALVLSKTALPSSVRDRSEYGKLVVEILQLTKKAYDLITS